MGMFMQRREEENTWAALPGEPAGADASDELPPSSVDPIALDFGGSVTSIVFPVAAPTPEAADYSDSAPKDPEGEHQD